MSNHAYLLSQRFDSMLDALIDSDQAAAFEYGSVAASKQDFAWQALKLIAAALRTGKPSQRMMNLLSEHVAKIKPEHALSVLSVAESGRPAAAFRAQVARDTFICLCSHPDDPKHPDAGDPDHPDNREALIHAYDAYFSGEGRSYAADKRRPGVAEQTMKNVIKPLMHAAGLLKRRAPGRKKIGV